MEEEEGISNLSLKNVSLPQSRLPFCALAPFVWFGFRHIWKIICPGLIGRLTVLLIRSCDGTSSHCENTAALCHWFLFFCHQENLSLSLTHTPLHKLPGFPLVSLSLKQLKIHLSSSKSHPLRFFSCHRFKVI